jgi:raffinose synthase
MEEFSEHEFTLGSLKTCHRLLACARVNRYWMGPAFGTSSRDIPLDTQFLLVELTEGGPYALLLPLVDAGFRATLQASDHKDLEVVCFSESGDKSWTTKNGMLALYVAIGDDPFSLLKQGFQQVADGTGTFQTLDRKKIPSTVDDFGWCSWDAFYSKVTPEGILQGVAALKEAGVPPRNVILDDGWQEVGPTPKSWSEEETHDGLDTGKTQPTRSVLQYFTDPIVNMVTEQATNYYTNNVQRAPYGSLHNRIWVYLARTVLKQGLWTYFDTQTDFARQLNGFEPNFKFDRASHGVVNDYQVASLKDMVSRLKVDHGVKNVYCWHAIHGYWRGISAELGKKIGIDTIQVHPMASKHLLRLDPQSEFDPPSLFGVGMITKAEDLKKFYEHIHAPLVEAGVDGVKVDVQSGVTAAGSGVGGGPHIARLYTEAMEESVAKNFAPNGEGGGAINCINCMCHSTENLYRYKKTAVARASEDFFPHRPESHSVHLVNVAYNSLFIGEICLPDWDMFHSLHASAELHAAARAIGGCPVYVSDVPGQHNVTLLKKLVLPDGSILRAQLPGRPTRDCLFTDVGQDGTSALKIWNQNKAGGGVVGTFHVQGVAWNFHTHENEVLEQNPDPITASVKPHDVETLRNHYGPFAIWGHKSASLRMVENGDTSLESSLQHRDWDVFTIVPVQQTDSVSWAPIGLGEMLNSGGALEVVGPLDETIVMDDTTGQLRMSTTADITTRGPGRFVAYSQPAPSSIMINDGRQSRSSTLSFVHDSASGLLSFELPTEMADKQPHQVTIVWDDASSNN